MARLTILQWGAVVSLLSLLMRQAQGEGIVPAQPLPSFSDVSSGGPLTKTQFLEVISSSQFIGYFPEGVSEELGNELMMGYDKDGDEEINEEEYDEFCDSISISFK
ncbi:hypothetical protein COCON_G00005800 [Conger conger]|uniref:EF-hand domain-containing protein n=1 Tax=Conger conger TaxID=82655 RepID=A0A9Q1E1I5_CONCO|nr:hypothetical protein COCON_G00005800 [Conger conger]